MGILLFLLLLFGLVSIVLPWVNFARLNRLERELRALQKAETGALTDRPALQNTAFVAPAASSRSDLAFPRNENQIPTAEKAEERTDPPQELITAAQDAGEEAATADAIPVTRWPVSSLDTAQEKSSLERNLGLRLPVWIGGVALAFAGFYMIKFSIEKGLISPSVRLTIGFVFGLVMLYGSDRIRKRETVANGVRIAQALSGAGLAVLYGCFYAAASRYDLMPPAAGFLGMGVVTTTAIVLSIRHGMPIALLGMVGGFVAPLLVSSEQPNASVLFGYLYLLALGLLVTIRTRNWWILSPIIMIACLIWVVAWLVADRFGTGGSEPVMLFLIALSMTAVLISRDRLVAENPERLDVVSPSFVLNAMAVGGTLLLAAVSVGRSNYETLDWGLFGFLTAGAIGLAVFDPRLYGPAPFVALAVTLAALAAWTIPDSGWQALVLTIFALLHTVSGMVLQTRGRRPLIWAGLGTAATIAFYALAFLKFGRIGLIADIPRFWGLLALAIAVLHTIVLSRNIKTVPDEHPSKQSLLALGAGSVTAFLAIGFAIELPVDFLPVALSLEVLALSWINNRLPIRALRMIIAALLCVFAALILPAALIVLLVSTGSGPMPGVVAGRLQWPVLQIGLPALFIGAASLFLRRQKNDVVTHACEVGALALLSVTGYHLLRVAFHGFENLAYEGEGFLERGVITSAFFALGLLCHSAGSRIGRPTLRWVGLALFVVASSRFLALELVLHQPLIHPKQVGSMPVLNTLLVNYGLPVLWFLLAARSMAGMGYDGFADAARGLSVALGILFLTLQVRQAFHGSDLTAGPTETSEIYAYSVVWLVYGVLLLILGAWKRLQILRFASLATMVLTVGKVFLYDAAALEGLLRVFSFLGLGVSLLALSWFYGRFVFARQE